MRQKIRRLKLEVVVHGEKSGGTTTSNLVLPEELISAEDALKALSQPGLPRQDIQRLGLEVVVDKQQTTGSRLSTTNFELPEDLPSVEEQLKVLACCFEGV